MTTAQVTFDEVRVASDGTPAARVTFDQVRVASRESPGNARITYQRLMVISSVEEINLPATTQPIINICM